MDYSQFKFCEATITLAVYSPRLTLNPLLDELQSGQYGPARNLGSTSKAYSEVAFWRIDDYIGKNPSILVINFKRCLDKAILFKTKYCSTRHNGEWILPIMCRHYGIVDHANDLEPTNCGPSFTLQD